VTTGLNFGNSLVDPCRGVSLDIGFIVARKCLWAAWNAELQNISEDYEDLPLIECSEPLMHDFHDDKVLDNIAT
jgi:hypothetical protein